MTIFKPNGLIEFSQLIGKWLLWGLTEDGKLDYMEFDSRQEASSCFIEFMEFAKKYGRNS